MIFNFFNVYLFVWERETVCECERGRDRETETESQAGSRFWAFRTEPDAGLELTNCEMTWAEVRRLTDWATWVPQHSSYDLKTEIEALMDIHVYWNTVYNGHKKKKKKATLWIKTNDA